MQQVVQPRLEQLARLVRVGLQPQVGMLLEQLEELAQVGLLPRVQ
jgi:hypothetical protein